MKLKKMGRRNVELGGLCYIPSDESGLYLAVLYFCSSRNNISYQMSNPDIDVCAQTHDMHMLPCTKQTDVEICAPNNCYRKVISRKEVFIPASGFSHGK